MDRITKIFLGIMGVLVLVIIFITLVGTKAKNKDLDNYDISSMKEVSVKEINEMFNDKGTYVLMFGASSCAVCQKLLPDLVDAQKELNYTTRYIDVLSIDYSSSSWKELSEHLSMKTTQKISEDDSGEEETNTYGYFLENYAFAPTVVIIKEGKQIGGFIGGVDTKDLIPWIRAKIK